MVRRCISRCVRTVWGELHRSFNENSFDAELHMAPEVTARSMHSITEVALSYSTHSRQDGVT